MGVGRAGRAIRIDGSCDALGSRLRGNDGVGGGNDVRREGMMGWGWENNSLTLVFARGTIQTARGYGTEAQ